MKRHDLKISKDNLLYVIIIVAFILIGAYTATLLLETDDFTTRQVRLQLKWKHQFQFAGYYAAKEKGFYEDEGLRVDILPYDGEDPVKAVVEGRAEFGIGNSELLVNRANGDDIVILAAIFQHSPLVFLTKDDSEIQSVQDFIGKKVALEAQSAELDVFLKSEGVDRSDFRVMPHGTSTQPLIDGEVDVMSAYLTDEPYELKRLDIGYKVISARSSGIDFYGDCLFTTSDMVKKNPELVKSMIAASLKGWSYAFDNESEVIQLIRSKYDMRHSAEHLAFEADQMERVVLPDAIEIGYMNANRWKAIEKIFLSAGIIKDSVDMDGFLYGIASEGIEGAERLVSWSYIALALALAVTVAVFAYLPYRKRLKVENELRRELNDAEVEIGKLKTIVDSLHCPFVISSLDKDEIIFANEAALKTFKVEGSIRGHKATEFYVRPEQRLELKNDIRHDKVVNRTLEAVRMTGERIWVSGSSFVTEFDGKKAIFSSFIDVTEHKLTEQKLTSSQLRIQTMTDQLPVAILECDADGRICFANRTCMDIFGVETIGLLENKVSEHIPLKEINRLSFKEHQIVAIKREAQGECYFDMSIAYRMESGIIVAYYVVLSDITEMKRAEEKLKLMAVTDELTNLVNRREFYRRSAIELVRANRNASTLSVVMMDIDHFKLINDTFGHDIGDVVLSGLGKLLISSVRASDIVSRFGGEEMVILLPETDMNEALEFSERLRGRIERLQFESREGITFKVTASFGLSVFNPLEEKLDMDTLIQRADEAMYEAKKGGRNQVVSYHTIER